METSVQAIVDKLELVPHPEGGFYRETYRSKGTIAANCLLPEFAGERNYATSIYFLLTSENFSGFHRIRQDEQWHFYSGSPLHVHVINPEGEYECLQLGLDWAHDYFPQHTVEAGSWFASSVVNPQSYSLVGCTVAPGFDFDDFELATRDQLSALYPQHVEVINKYCRK